MLASRRRGIAPALRVQNRHSARRVEREEGPGAHDGIYPQLRITICRLCATRAVRDAQADRKRWRENEPTRGAMRTTGPGARRETRARWRGRHGESSETSARSITTSSSSTGRYLHLPVAGFNPEPMLQEHVPSGRQVPWSEEIAGSSLQVQSCPGVQTHWLRNVLGQHQAIELIGSDVHPASTKRPLLLKAGASHLHPTGGSEAAHVMVPREQPLMHPGLPSYAPVASWAEFASLVLGPS
jgi:hypothetical protein